MRTGNVIHAAGEKCHSVLVELIHAESHQIRAEGDLGEVFFLLGLANGGLRLVGHVVREHLLVFETALA